MNIQASDEQTSSSHNSPLLCQEEESDEEIFSAYRGARLTSASRRVGVQPRGRVRCPLLVVDLLEQQNLARFFLEWRLNSLKEKSTTLALWAVDQGNRKAYEVERSLLAENSWATKSVIWEGYHASPLLGVTQSTWFWAQSSEENGKGRAAMMEALLAAGKKIEFLNFQLESARHQLIEWQGLADFHNVDGSWISLKLREVERELKVARLLEDMRAAGSMVKTSDSFQSAVEQVEGEVRVNPKLLEEWIKSAEGNRERFKTSGLWSILTDPSSSSLESQLHDYLACLHPHDEHARPQRSMLDANEEQKQKFLDVCASLGVDQDRLKDFVCQLEILLLQSFCDLELSAKAQEEAKKELYAIRAELQSLPTPRRDPPEPAPSSSTSLVPVKQQEQETARLDLWCAELAALPLVDSSSEGGEEACASPIHAGPRHLTQGEEEDVGGEKPGRRGGEEKEEVEALKAEILRLREQLTHCQVQLQNAINKPDLLEWIM